MKQPLLLLAYACTLQLTNALIDRHTVVSRYNPTRNASSSTTPMQVGNGNFAFGVDITGLQTFLPYAIMSSWGWKNDSFPPNKTLADIENYTGVSWLSHGRPVQYNFGGEATAQSWLISNPNRVNLGRFGLVFLDEEGSEVQVMEGELENVRQETDLWTGVLTSRFVWDGEDISVQTICHQSVDSIGIQIQSNLVQKGRIGVFMDFPWNDGKAKFSAPFVGAWNATANHTTTLTQRDGLVTINHTLDASSFFTSIQSEKPFEISRASVDAHRYNINVSASPSDTFSFTAAFALEPSTSVPTVSEINESSAAAWSEYWLNSGFVDVFTGSTDPRADELQRRIILSRYLMRVNEAGDTPPQESGLVNNGWYGKFHMEMYWWHSAHWALWNNWDLLHRSLSVYNRFLPSAIARAQVQEGYASGARWSKMTDPSGRSAPGQINELLIWQQVHPLVFAQYEYRAFPSNDTLEKWASVVRETANWMAEFAWFNTSTGVYDLGPPMYVVSEDTSPNVTVNPAFELAYWRMGFDIAETWMTNLGQDVPSKWTEVKNNLAVLPVSNGTYSVYEGIETDFWTDPAYTNDHPSLVGLHGWLPPTPGVDLNIAKLTAERVWTSWNVSNCWGWDFPMLAMSAARIGNPEKAVEWLLDPLFIFDDVGMPVGGVRVPTPYFPGSGSLLLAVAMMARGEESEKIGWGFPSEGWNIQAENIAASLG